MEIRNVLPPWLLESCVLSTYHTVAYSRTLYVKCEWAWTASLNDCKTKKGNFVASINWFIGNFSHNVPLNCYIRLFQAYCSSYYGSVLWELFGRGCKDFCVTWNKAVRRVFNVPYTTHTILLGQLLNTCHVSMQLVKRLCKFIDGMLSH